MHVLLHQGTQALTQTYLHRESPDVLQIEKGRAAHEGGQ